MSGDEIDHAPNDSDVWYIYRPKPADYAAVQKAAAEYFSAFKV